MTIKLSICMMVKDEEENLQRCLDSLQELREKVSSELIIVDTGSKDETVKIAKKYTDRVYFHPWNNNFSEMRNITINYAQGNWIFIIDADEELDSAQEIVKFLSSSIQNKFNAGLVTIKNLTIDNQEERYALISAPRLFRNDGYFHYQGAVHNSPKFQGNGIAIRATLIHYGYISTDKELMERKFKRTAGLLKTELAKDPENIYYRFQLSVSYAMNKEDENALEEIIKAYDLIKKDRLIALKYVYVYCQLAKCYLANKYYEKTEEVCLEGLELEKEYIDLYYFMAQAQIELGKNDEAIKNCEHFIALVENYDNLNIRHNPAITMHTLFLTEAALHNIAVTCYREGQLEKALDYGRKITSSRFIPASIELIAECSIKLKFFKQLKEYREKIIGNSEEYEDIFSASIEKHKKNLNKDEEIELYKIFAGKEGIYNFLCALRIIYEEEKDFEKLYYRISQLIKDVDFNKLPDYYGDIIYYLIKTEKSLVALFATMPENNINRFMKYLDDKYADLAENIWDYLQKNDRENSFQETRTNKILRKYLLLSGHFSDDRYISIFNKYLNNGIEFIQTLYNENIIYDELINDVKNVEEAFFIYMFLALEKKEDKLTYVSYLKKAYKIYPYMSKGIESLLEEVEATTNENREINATFENYTVQLKEKLQKLIELNQLDEAEKFIAEYETITELDSAFYSIKAVILMMKNDFNQAEKIVKQGLSKNSTDFDLLYNLAYIYEQQGKENKAANVYKAAERNAKNNDEKNEAYFALRRLQKTIAMDNYHICDNKDPEKMIILHGTIEIANQMNTLTKGLKYLGMEAKTINYYPNYLGYQSDYTYDILREKNINKVNRDLIKISEKAINENDIFHFHFGTSLTIDHSDLPILQENGKKVFMHHWGSDVRMYSKAVKINKYIRVKTMDEESIKNKLKVLSKYIKNCIVADYELYEYVKDYYEKVHMIPQIINLDRWEVAEEHLNNKKTLIVHAPTDPVIKGTDYIINTINKLKNKYDFDFILVKNMPHEQARQIYRRADIIIDQVMIGIYGVFAIEAMAMGKPVITWISDYMKEKYPKDLPIVSANPDNLEEKLKMLLVDKELRKVLGKQGREYVEKYHDMEVVATKLLELYQSV